MGFGFGGRVRVGARLRLRRRFSAPPVAFRDTGCCLGRMARSLGGGEQCPQPCPHHLVGARVGVGVRVRVRVD